MAETKVIIRFNKEQGGIELEFGKGVKLGEAEMNTLKEHGFTWHRKNHYWYSRYTAERIDWVRKTFKDEAKALTKTVEKSVAETAAKKAAEAPKRAPKKKSASDEIAELREQIAALTKMLAPAK